ncbi:MAG: ferredoxin reductase [Pseudomonadota bacterium]
MSSQFVLPSFISRTLQAVVTPTVLDFWAAELGFDARIERTMSRVVARWMETPDTVTLVLKPNKNFRGFSAGQHVNLTVEIDGVRHTRSYSFSEAPAATGLVAITIKKVPNGRVSGHLVDKVVVGDTIELGQAFGDMTFSAGAPEKMLFLAAGSGVTPLMSLLRQLVAEGMNRDVVFMYWVRTRQDLIFGKELKALAEQYPNFRLQPVYELEPELEAGELSGRPSREQLGSVVKDLCKRSVYVCGPTGFMNAVQALVADDALAFHAEAFSPPVFVPSKSTGIAKLFLSKSNRTLEVPEGMPLLDALEAQGIKPQSGCRMGICNTCACGKASGVTRNLLNNELSVDANASLRICVNAAVGDITLDL